METIDPKDALKHFYKFVKNVSNGPYNMSINEVMDISWDDLIGIVDTSSDPEDETPLDIADIFDGI